jgi:arylformamidase
MGRNMARNQGRRIMTTVNFEAEYNNRERVPEHVGIMQRWAAASADVRSSLTADLDLPYGPGPRHRYDLFKGATDRAPLVVYIHGGYWQRGEREANAFVARELVARGLAVALPSYTLCPDGSVRDIIAEMRAFLASLWVRTRQYPVIVGHSAGGHLAAALLAAGAPPVADVPADMVRAAYSISGVFDLVPLLETSLNAALRLDLDTANAVSPIHWPAPPKSCRFVAAVGGAESSEFLRQNLDMAGIWSAAGVKAECVVVPGANHFTIVDELVRPDSMMLVRVHELAVSCANGPFAS